MQGLPALVFHRELGAPLILQLLADMQVLTSACLSGRTFMSCPACQLDRCQVPNPSILLLQSHVSHVARAGTTTNRYSTPQKVAFDADHLLSWATVLQIYISNLRSHKWRQCGRRQRGVGGFCAVLSFLRLPSTTFRPT